MEDKEEKLDRYMNELKVPIQDELSLHTPTSMNKCYHLAIKLDEKWKRKQNQSKGKENNTNKSFKGKNKSWGKGQNNGNKTSD